MIMKKVKISMKSVVLSTHKTDLATILQKSKKVKRLNTNVEGSKSKNLKWTNDLKENVNYFYPPRFLIVEVSI